MSITEDSFVEWAEDKAMSPSSPEYYWAEKAWHAALRVVHVDMEDRSLYGAELFKFPDSCHEVTERDLKR